ncbi:hypothetical protein [Flavobacterium psychrophilum]|nr:hypothetical protein [Flavobacterium psychrophilum]
MTANVSTLAVSWGLENPNLSAKVQNLKIKTIFPSCQKTPIAANGC